MRAYLIDPFNETVSEVAYGGNIDEIHRAIDCKIFTCITLNSQADAVYIDEEGLTNGKYQDFFKLRNYPDPLAGKAMVIGTDEDGEAVSPAVTLDDLKRQIRFIPGFAMGFFVHRRDGK